MSGKEEESSDDQASYPPGPRARKLQSLLDTALQTYTSSLKLEKFVEAFPNRNSNVDAILKEGFQTFLQDITTNTRVNENTFCSPQLYALT